MRDTRQMRQMLYLGLSAAVIAILGDKYIKPTIEKAIK